MTAPYPERDDVWLLAGDVVRVLKVHTDGRTSDPDPADIRHSDGRERTIMVADLMDSGKLIAHEHRYTGTITRTSGGYEMVGYPYRCRCGEPRPAVDIRRLFDPASNARMAKALYRSRQLIWSTPAGSGHFSHHNPEATLSRTMAEEAASRAFRPDDE